MTSGVSTLDAQRAQMVEAARAALGIREWLDLVSTEKTVELAVDGFDAKFHTNPDNQVCMVTICGICTGSASGPGAALRAWCDQVLSEMGQLLDLDPLEIFLTAFGGFGGLRLAAVAQLAVDAGAGSWVKPDTHALRITTHMYELDMFGVRGCGSCRQQSALNWRIAGSSELEGRTAQRTHVVAA